MVRVKGASASSTGRRPDFGDAIERGPAVCADEQFARRPFLQVVDALQAAFSAAVVVIGETTRAPLEAVETGTHRPEPQRAVRVFRDGVDRVVRDAVPPVGLFPVTGEAFRLFGECAKPFAVGSDPDSPVFALVNGRNIVLCDGVVVIGKMAVDCEPVRFGVPAEKPRIDGRDPDLPPPGPR